MIISFRLISSSLMLKTVGGAAGTAGAAGAAGALCGQGCTLHFRFLDPLHGFPPWAGAGLLHWRDCVPPPQILLHLPQLPQLPSMGQVAPWHG